MFGQIFCYFRVSQTRMILKNYELMLIHKIHILPLSFNQFCSAFELISRRYDLNDSHFFCKKYIIYQISAKTEGFFLKIDTEFLNI